MRLRFGISRLGAEIFMQKLEPNSQLFKFFVRHLLLEVYERVVWTLGIAGCEVKSRPC